jgi:hypothetical protein
MPGSITSANATFMLAVPPLFAIPQQLQGFSADNIFGTDPLEAAEVSMGIDGRLSGGFVFVPVRQSIEFQADSLSITIFETWYESQQLIRELYRATGVILLTSIGKKWTLNNGILTTYPPIPDAAKTLRPQRFGITWESMQPSVT